MRESGRETLTLNAYLEEQVLCLRSINLEGYYCVMSVETHSHTHRTREKGDPRNSEESNLLKTGLTPLPSRCHSV